MGDKKNVITKLKTPQQINDFIIIKPSHKLSPMSIEDLYYLSIFFFFKFYLFKSLWKKKFLKKFDPKKYSIQKKEEKLCDSWIARSIVLNSFVCCIRTAHLSNNSSVEWNVSHMSKYLYYVYWLWRAHQSKMKRKIFFKSANHVDMIPESQPLYVTSYMYYIQIQIEGKQKKKKEKKVVLLLFSCCVCVYTL